MNVSMSDEQNVEDDAQLVRAPAYSIPEMSPAPGFHGEYQLSSVPPRSTTNAPYQRPAQSYAVNPPPHQIQIPVQMQQRFQAFESYQSMPYFMAPQPFPSYPYRPQMFRANAPLSEPSEKPSQPGNYHSQQTSLPPSSSNSIQYVQPTNYAPPPANYATSPSNYANPPANYATSPSNYTNPPSNYATPPSNYANPPSNYANPPSNYANPPTNPVSNYHSVPVSSSLPPNSTSLPPNNPMAFSNHSTPSNPMAQNYSTPAANNKPQQPNNFSSANYPPVPTNYYSPNNNPIPPNINSFPPNMNSFPPNISSFPPNMNSFPPNINPSLPTNYSTPPIRYPANYQSFSEEFNPANRMDPYMMPQMFPNQSKDAVNVNASSVSQEFTKLIELIVDALKDDNRAVDELKFVLSDNYSDEELKAMKDVGTVLNKMMEKKFLGEDNLDSLEAYLRISHKKLCKRVELFRNSSNGKIDESSLEQIIPPGQYLFQSQRPKGEPREVETGGIHSYPMEKVPHGICAVFNNQNFDTDELGKRKGSEMDRDKLCDLFSYLNYEVRVYNDLSADKMESTMKELSEVDHTGHDSFICCILTHGAENDILFGSDGAELKLKEMMSHFYASSCKTLFGKPKIFFIQACRGDREDLGFSNELIDAVPQDFTDRTEHYDSEDLPETADFLIAFPTSSGYVSWRSHNEGTWYIKSLCDLMKDNHNQHDLMSILTMVNGQVAERKTDDGQKQMPAPVTHLRKLVHIRN